MRAMRTIPLTVLLTLAAVPALPGAGAAAETAQNGAFEMLEALEGDWMAAEDGEMAARGDLVAQYRVTAGGSAVVETSFPGTDHEMVTVYHAEGPDLILTHYCIEGNQPRMRARDARGPRLEFVFDGGGNIADPKRDRHMHRAWIEILGPDELRSEWTELADGEPVLVVPMHLVRKKD